MEIFNRLNNAVNAFRKTKVESGADPNAFLKYGKNRMPSTWSTPDITDEDFYTGIGFAVVNKRANRSVVLGKKFLFTEAKEDIVKKANDKGLTITHPYVDLIRDSIDFAERDFWYDISTYLDLEGIYYLMAVRTVTASGKVGNVQKFSLLNPYWVKPVVNTKGELGGYAESNPYLGNRIIAKEMIIPIKLLNPFDPTKPYSLADAARDSQFTLKQANDFARESINGNLNSPGIISSAIELPDDQFDNFVTRVKGHNRGEPLFGNGAGTISWTSMQTDLDKAALDKINSINRDVLISVSGLSTSGMGLEQAGTGREVSRTQKDDFTENAIMPQVENIIDALNLDYRRFYADQYKLNKYVITLDNPLETNRDAEQADVDIRQSQFDLQQSLVDKGYDKEIAAKYAKGLISITDLGEPTNEPKAPPVPLAPLNPDGTPVTPVVPPVDPKAPPVDPKAPVVPPAKKKPVKKPKNDYKDKEFSLYEGYPIPLKQYLDDNADQINPISETGSFIYSTEDVDKVRIDHIEEANNSLVAIVDENTFITLGTFNQNADRVVILAKLNKRYTNQLVAVKKKVDLTHDHSYGEIEVIKNAAFDKQVQIEQNKSDLLSSAQAAEDSMYEWYVHQIGEGNTDPHADIDPFAASMGLPLAVYFTVMFPIYASHHVQETATKLGLKDELPIVAMTEELKQQIKEFAAREATAHMNTLKTDIETALTLIRSKTTDPTQMKEMFEKAYAQIRMRRSEVIANTASAKIFNLSQYEADLQFLTRAGLVHQAYKVLFSLSGDPCPFCAKLIAESNANPIPFTAEFAALGSKLEADGKTLHFNYEAIVAGNVHPNCRCAYKLVIKNDVA